LRNLLPMAVLAYRDEEQAPLDQATVQRLNESLWHVLNFSMHSYDATETRL
jgi:hypothetical protein